MQILMHSFKAMGGQGQIQLANTPQAQSALHDALAELRRLEAQYSRYRTDSLVSTVNANAGLKPTACDAETESLLDFAQQLYERSQGLFDITSGVYRRAWDFASGQIPDQALLDQLKPLVGWNKIERHAHHIWLPQKGMEIDFGGLVKEYAVDRACLVLQSQGVESALVSLAGDLKAIGTKPDGQPWQAGIAHPRKPGQLLSTITLQSMALATSGDYERAIILNGQRYSHIIHPHTGWPVSYWQSVSVQASSCLVAGSLCTLAMLLQIEGLTFLQETGLTFLAVDPDGAAMMPVMQPAA
jgi:thiamine biosynthesis lipoprotein